MGGGENVKYTPLFFCKDCKTSIPELRNVLEITKKQQKFQADLDEHDTRITKFEQELEKLNKITIEGLDTRLAALEAKQIDKESIKTIAETCFSQTDFPSLQTQKQLEDTIQSTTKKQLEETREEAIQREDRMKNLIVYGIKEIHNDRTEQMKADFTAIKTLYSEKVDLCSKDLLQVTRLGKEAENKIRPIKITFADLQKRNLVLRNNKNLKLYGDNGETCSLDFCEDGDEHVHIYINTDKTKQQMKEEKELREELKRRKQTETNLIIRNGKIITKSTHARWVEVAEDGF